MFRLIFLGVRYFRRLAGLGALAALAVFCLSGEHDCRELAALELEAQIRWFGNGAPEAQRAVMRALEGFQDHPCARTLARLGVGGRLCLCALRLMVPLVCCGALYAVFALGCLMFEGLALRKRARRLDSGYALRFAASRERVLCLAGLLALGLQNQGSAAGLIALAWPLTLRVLIRWLCDLRGPEPVA